MSEWLSDREKRILFSALTREKKVCAEIDKEVCVEPYEESLVSTVESLEHKFYYDRLFKQMEKQIKAEVIDEFIDKVSESIIWDILAEVMKRNIGASEGADRIIEYLQKIAKELKEQSK